MPAADRPTSARARPIMPKLVCMRERGVSATAAPAPGAEVSTSAWPHAGHAGSRLSSWSSGNWHFGQRGNGMADFPFRPKRLHSILTKLPSAHPALIDVPEAARSLNERRVFGSHLHGKATE